MIITIQSGILSNNQAAVCMQLDNLTLQFETGQARSIGIMLLESAISAEMELAMRESLIKHGHTVEEAITILKDLKIISSARPSNSGNLYGNEQNS